MRQRGHTASARSWDLKVDVGAAVTRRRHVDQTSSPANQRRNPVDEDIVAQATEPVRWDIRDDNIEQFASRQQSIGAGQE
jgi:hypothetical protein